MRVFIILYNFYPKFTLAEANLLCARVYLVLPTLSLLVFVPPPE
jgi:hypothetical protein